MLTGSGGRSVTSVGRPSRGLATRGAKDREVASRSWMRLSWRSRGAGGSSTGRAALTMMTSMMSLAAASGARLMKTSARGSRQHCSGCMAALTWHPQSWSVLGACPARRVVVHQVVVVVSGSAALGVTGGTVIGTGGGTGIGTGAAGTGIGTGGMTGAAAEVVVGVTEGQAHQQWCISGGGGWSSGVSSRSSRGVCWVVGGGLHYRGSPGGGVVWL